MPAKKPWKCKKCKKRLIQGPNRAREDEGMRRVTLTTETPYRCEKCMVVYVHTQEKEYQVVEVEDMRDVAVK